MTRPDRIRLGIVGLGAVAQAVYAPLLARHRDRIEVAAVADLSSILRDAIGGLVGAPQDRRFASGEELVAADGLDAVAILTSGSHGALAEAALAAGLAVLCEKPLAYTLAEAERLAALPTADRLMLAYMKLYDPAVERALELRRDRPSIRSLEVIVLHPSAEAQLEHARLARADDLSPDQLDALRADTDALRQRALGPGATALGPLYTEILLGSVVHELALVRVFAGDPMGIDHADSWPADAWPPSIAAEGRLVGGGRLSIRWHYLPRYPAYREEVRMHDEAGSVELVFPSPYLLHAATELMASEAVGRTSRRIRERSIEEAFERQLLAFHGLVTAGERPRAGVEEGRADIDTCQRIAARLAAFRGMPLGGEAAGEGRAAPGAEPAG